MIGPRDRRPPYRGTWYPYSSNGWGIVDFLDFCEAAGFRCIPAFNMDETPQDMADFVEYVKGPPTALGAGTRRRRPPAALPPEAHRAGQRGARERRYWPFPGPRGGDLGQGPRDDPRGGRLRLWPAHQRPVALHRGRVGRQHAGRHSSDHRSRAAARPRGLVRYPLGTEGPPRLFHGSRRARFIDALGQCRPGPSTRSSSSSSTPATTQQRALANAWPSRRWNASDGSHCLSANCLQPDGQNDNDWDQGLLFLNPSQVWLQPPGYVTAIVARNVPAAARHLPKSTGDANNWMRKPTGARTAKRSFCKL